MSVQIEGYLAKELYGDKGIHHIVGFVDENPVVKLNQSFVAVIPSTQTVFFGGSTHGKQNAMMGYVRDGGQNLGETPRFPWSAG